MKVSGLAWWLCVAGIGAWTLMGFFPLYYFGSYEKAAVVGDAFNLANSFFSSIGFVVAMCALMLQMKETHDAGIRDVEQSKLQAEQMEITRRTAEQQEAMVRDAQRTQAMAALIKVDNDLNRFLRALIALSEGSATSFVPSEHEIRMADFETARDEFQGNRLRLRILFGEITESLNLWIDVSVPRTTGGHFFAVGLLVR